MFGKLPKYFGSKPYLIITTLRCLYIAKIIDIYHHQTTAAAEITIVVVTMHFG